MCNLIPKDAQWMLNGCSKDAEWMLNGSSCPRHPSFVMIIIREVSKGDYLSLKFCAKIRKKFIYANFTQHKCHFFMKNPFYSCTCQKKVVTLQRILKYVQ